MEQLVQKLAQTRNLTDEELLQLLQDGSADPLLHKLADQKRREIYGTDIYVRGLIEVSNYCKNDCYYCGIRRSNCNAERYRLTKEDILECCDHGYQIGFRTFVMQGGEDNHITDDMVCETVQEIKHRYPDCAVTLSLGERSRESYQRFYNAGADRYLLRHETATPSHYAQLHPENLTLEHRLECLQNLKDIGFQVGAGFMVGSPYQTLEHLVADLRFLQRFRPDMVGIGPFLQHHDTPFKDFPNGSLELTLRLLSIVRLMLPYVLLPSTTALITLDPKGRELGILAGGNVVMPNLSPMQVRKKYTLYDNKAISGDEAAEALEHLRQQMASIGYHVVTARGDVKK